MMDIARFQDLLDIHGADIESWPSAERAAAQGLLSHESEALRRIEDARRLDTGLAGLLGREAADPALRARLNAIGARPEARRRPERRRWTGFLLASPWPIGAGAAMASLALGLWLGARLAPPPVPTESLDVMSLAYGLPIDLKDLP